MGKSPLDEAGEKVSNWRLPPSSVLAFDPRETGHRQNSPCAPDVPLSVRAVHWRQLRHPTAPGPAQLAMARWMQKSEQVRSYRYHFHDRNTYVFNGTPSRDVESCRLPLALGGSSSALAKKFCPSPVAQTLRNERTRVSVS